VRYRLMATYDGSPFEAGIGPTEDDIVLFAACPPPEELGFEPATGHWRKQLRFAEVQAVWESRPVGRFGGERCLVLDDLGDRLHIGYLGHDGFKAEQLGYWQVDRGVFELIAPRSEVTGILEERVELTRPAGRPAAAAGPISDEATEHGQLGSSEPHSGPIPVAAVPPAPPAPVYVPIADDQTGVTLPTPAELPLPLEAEAMRAASASRRQEEPAMAARPVPAAAPQDDGEPSAEVALTPPEPLPDGQATAPRRRAAAPRLATEALFADLASLAGIPAESYSVGAEVEGALCLLQTEQGFEVFLYADDARHELQFFASEEAACFYLFGVLAADAVRTGVLTPVTDAPDWRAGQPEPAPAAVFENFAPADSRYS
jgi:hypothetical protein